MAAYRIENVKTHQQTTFLEAAISADEAENVRSLNMIFLAAATTAH